VQAEQAVNMDSFAAQIGSLHPITSQAKQVNQKSAAKNPIWQS
jgi:hypothetical protein